MKLNMLKKLFLGAALAASISMSAVAAGPSYVVKVLDSYSQLTSYTGKDGVYFVREAGKGQNSDPNVKSGWALYVYDGRASKFKLVSKQEAMGGSAGVGAAYLTEALYHADINPYKYQIRDADTRSKANATEITSLKNADAVIVTSLNDLTATTGTLTAQVNDISAVVSGFDVKAAQAEAIASNANAVAEATAATLANITPTVGTLSERIEAVAATIDTSATELRGYTDTKVADLKVDIITNTAVRMRSTLTVATNFTNQAKIDAIAAAGSDATSKDEAVTETLRGEIGAAKSEAIASANTYTDGKLGGLLTTNDAAATYQPKGDYLTEHQDISGKADKASLFKDGAFFTELSNSNGTKSRFWNELGGGGIQLLDVVNNIKTCFAVNEGSAGPGDTLSPLCAQIYAINDSTKLGTRICISDTWAYLTHGNTYRWTLDDAIVVKKDLASYQPAGSYLTASDIEGKANTDDVYTKTQADERFLTSHQDISGKLDASVAAETYQPKGSYISVGDALELPLKVKKGNKVYVLDVVDNGGGDISLSVNEAPVE